jgi:hypothetical protein
VGRQFNPDSWLHFQTADAAMVQEPGGPIHFIAADLAAVRHNYELKPRPEVVLLLDAKQSGLGDSSCGPGAGTLRGFTN